MERVVGASLDHGVVKMKARRRPPAWPAGAIALAAAVCALSGAGAQDRSAVIRVLDDQGGDFRVRVQAAFAAGNSQAPASEAPLARALHDPNPAVRAAAATSLGRLGAPSAIPALQAARHDSSAAVRMQAEHAIELLEAAPAATPAVVPNT